jgi:hypothetical protein
MSPSSLISNSPAYPITQPDAMALVLCLLPAQNLGNQLLGLRHRIRRRGLVAGQLVCPRSLCQS